MDTFRVEPWVFINTSCPWLFKKLQDLVGIPDTPSANDFRARFFRERRARGQDALRIKQEVIDMRQNRILGEGTVAGRRIVMLADGNQARLWTDDQGGRFFDAAEEPGFYA